MIRKLKVNKFCYLFNKNNNKPKYFYIKVLTKQGCIFKSVPAFFKTFDYRCKTSIHVVLVYYANNIFDICDVNYLNSLETRFIQNNPTLYLRWNKSFWNHVKCLWICCVTCFMHLVTRILSPYLIYLFMHNISVNLKNFSFMIKLLSSQHFLT